jgi:hypothetical protein
VGRALVVGDPGGHGARQEGGIGQALPAGPQALELLDDLAVVGDEPFVPGGHLVEGPEGGRQLPGVAHAADLELVGAGQREVLVEPESLGLGPDVLLPRVGGDVEAALDGRPAEVEEPVAQAVPGRPAGLGHGEGRQPPAPVPPPAGGVLGVGQPGALEVAAELGGAGLGGRVDGVPTAAAAGEQPVAHQPAQARAHLLGGLAAGLGHRVQLVGPDGPVLVRHAEDEHPGRDRHGRRAHDRHADRPAGSGQSG